MFDQNLGGRIKDGCFEQISEFNNLPRKLERKLILFELNTFLKDLALDSQETTKDFSEISQIAASLSSTIKSKNFDSQKRSLEKYSMTYSYTMPILLISSIAWIKYRLFDCYPNLRTIEFSIMSH